MWGHRFLPLTHRAHLTRTTLGEYTGGMELKHEAPASAFRQSFGEEWPTVAEAKAWKGPKLRDWWMGGRPDRKRRASKNQRLEVLARDGNQCRYCGKDVTLRTAHIDHVTPWIRTGLTRVPNLVTSCAPCNKVKGMRLDVLPCPIGGPYTDPFKAEKKEMASIVREAQELDKEYRAICSE